MILSLLLLVLLLNQGTVFFRNVKNTNPKDTIQITASGKVTVAPDLAVVSATVHNDANTAVDAQSKNTQKMDAVINFLKSSGIDQKDITTSQYNVSPKYDYTRSNPTITGYTATQTVTIKVYDLTKVGSLLDGATSAGANQIDNVYFTFNDPDAIKEQARENALANAKEKAKKLADAAGLNLGKLVTFSETSSGYPGPIAYDTKAVAAGSGGAPVPAPETMVQPGTQDITADINVTYELR